MVETWGTRGMDSSAGKGSLGSGVLGSGVLDHETAHGEGQIQGFLITP